MPVPVIGVCAAYEQVRWGFWDMTGAIIASTYLKHIEHAGGVGMGLIPTRASTAAVEDLLGRVDGVLLIGGVDVNPRRYGEEAQAALESTNDERDEFEIAVIRASFARDLPVLGICRGLQIMNVSLGGTLHQHLDDVGHNGHRNAPGRLDEASFHDVEISPGTWAAAGVGEGRVTVNSHHHQGIAAVAPGAVVSGRSVGDDLPEALEWPEQEFALGVQWHPEALELGTTIAQLVSASRLRRDRVTATHTTSGADLA